MLRFDLTHGVVVWGCDFCLRVTAEGFETLQSEGAPSRSVPTHACKVDRIATDVQKAKVQQDGDAPDTGEILADWHISISLQG